MKRVLLIMCLLGAWPSAAQQYPSALATDANLLVAYDRAQSSLASAINNSVTTFAVNAASSFGNNMVVVIGTEQIFCTTFSGTTFSGCTRGYGASSAAVHSAGAAVYGYLVSSHHNNLADEIIAIENALGVNLGNVGPAGSTLGFQYNNAGSFGEASLKECAANLLGIGGCTSSFPAVMRDGVGGVSRLADNSADTDFRATFFNATDAGNGYYLASAKIYDSSKLVVPSYAGDSTGTPANGWMVYNSTSNKFRCYQNGAWADCIGGGGTPGGSNLDIQYNNAGAFGGSSLKECGTDFIGIGGCTVTEIGLDGGQEAGILRIEEADGTNDLLAARVSALYVQTNFALIWDGSETDISNGSSEDIHIQTVADAAAGDIKISTDSVLRATFVGEGGGVDIPEITAPSAPAANNARLYVKDDGGGTTVLCYKDSAGVETCPDEGGGGGYATIDDEDTPLTQRTTLNFAGAGVTCADDTDQTTCTIPAGSLPSQTGNANKLLSTDGSTADWRTIGAGLVNDATSLRVDDSTVALKTNTITWSAAQTFSEDITAGSASTVDFSGADATFPVQSGTTLPGTCTADKELFLDTDATDGQQLYVCNGAGTGWALVGDGGGADVVGIQLVIGNGTDVLSTGVAGYLEVPFACTINQITGLAKESGSAVVDVWKDTYANYPPTDADTITAAAPLTLSTAIKAQDATLTGWATSITAGDILGFNVDSATTITQLTVSIKCTK